MMSLQLGNASDHPRSRGVYVISDVVEYVNEGSSPLARGLRAMRSCEALDCGIIPARAGFTGGLADSEQLVQDHPRSRGVYEGTTIDEMRRIGSSPLARGLLVPVLGRMCTRRIIPARAGFT